METALLHLMFGPVLFLAMETDGVDCINAQKPLRAEEDLFEAIAVKITEAWLVRRTHDAEYLEINYMFCFRRISVYIR